MWTKEEDAELLKQREFLELTDLKLPGRTTTACISRLYSLSEYKRVEKQKLWTPEEHELMLIMRSQNWTFAMIAEELGRGLESVKTRWKRRDTFKGIRGYSDWTDKQLLDLVRKYLVKSRFTDREVGEPSANVISKRFGSWTNARIMAGLSESVDRETMVYLLDFYSFKKVGLTSRSLPARFPGLSFDILDIKIFSGVEEARQFEKSLLSRVDRCRIDGFSTECFIGEQNSFEAILAP